MRATGYSTGALAKGDFATALGWVQGTDSDAIELSALRENELPGLIAGIENLDLSNFKYRSIHAPKDFSRASEIGIVSLLLPLVKQGFFIVLHPDAIHDADAWKPLGSKLCLENMDARKSTGRTVEELALWFGKLPEASLCLDLGHARNVDPTMCEAIRLIMSFGNRLAEIHISEVGTSGDHVGMSKGCVNSFRSLAGRLKHGAAVIVESQVGRAEMGPELQRARDATGQ